MKIKSMFFLTSIILIAGYNSIQGKNPKLDYTAIVGDDLENKFQKIKENASELKNNVQYILHCISESDLKKEFFEKSLHNYTQINLNNDQNNILPTLLNEDNIPEMVNILKELCLEGRKQRSHFLELAPLFVDHGIEVDQTDQDIFRNSVVLLQLNIDCRRYEKELLINKLKQNLDLKGE